MSEVDLNKESKKFVEAVFTIGDNGGYRIYEWFKLFPKERELVEKEYVYLKAHLARQAYKEAGKDITKEMWNALYLALGKAFDPNLHDAVSQEASADVAEGTVLTPIDLAGGAG